MHTHTRTHARKISNTPQTFLKTHKACFRRKKIDPPWTDGRTIQTINAELPYTSMQVFNTEHES